MKELNKKDIDKIVQILNNGGVIALPTDTIYGFSCLATDDKAVKKICQMKQCDDAKLYIVLVSKNYDLHKLVDLSEEQNKFIKNNTPNPLTMIVNRNPNQKLAQNFYLPTIAIRIPNDEFLQAVLDKVGFMISTSSNVHGEKPINDFNIIKSEFENLDAIVQCSTKSSRATKSSTIIDLTTPDYKILRQGDYVPKIHI